MNELRRGDACCRWMPDLTMPLITTTIFLSVAWLILHAGRQYNDAIGHTLNVFALVLGLLVMAGVTAKLRAGLGVGRLTHRVEARSQAEPADANHARPKTQATPRPPE